MFVQQMPDEDSTERAAALGLRAVIASHRFVQRRPQPLDLLRRQQPLPNQVAVPRQRFYLVRRREHLDLSRWVLTMGIPDSVADGMAAGNGRLIKSDAQDFPPEELVQQLPMSCLSINSGCHCTQRTRNGECKARA